ALKDSDRLRVDPAIANYQQPKAKPPLKAEPVSRKKYSESHELFGHAQDFHWLIGTLEKNNQGQPCLRLAPANPDSSKDGLIHLLPESELASFMPGDLLFIEGELSNSPDRQASNSPQSSGVYHVRSVKLLEKAS